ncbi:MAG TPA: 2-dehydropantoate 2-reductase [Tepidisphaeraceae bacterium]|jgi:2-dehydropantoate 2-reductase|nr:2-dehydropantoate 2-reductase [Tepidisphaeraceae bacterium]
MLTSPTICIIGAGALGGYYGARLAQRGNNVHFLVRGDLHAIRQNGWNIKSCDGDFTLAPGQFSATDDPTKLPKSDLILVTLKTTSNDRLQSLIAPAIKQDTAILTLQNGLGNEERLAGLFGPARVLGGIAFTCINRIKPGKIHHMAEGWIRIGEFGGGPSPRASRIAEIFNEARIQCTVLDDLRRGRWEKLSWNIPFNGLGAVLDWTTDQVIATEQSADVARTLIEEVVAGAGALGVALPDGLATRQIEKTRPMGPYQTSMQVDRREGREMEVEAILGEPLRQGTAAGAAMPHLQMLYAMAKAVAAAKR